VKLEHRNELAVGWRDGGSEKEGIDSASMKPIYAVTSISRLHILAFLTRHLHLSHSIFYPSTECTFVPIPILVFKVWFWRHHVNWMGSLLSSYLRMSKIAGLVNVILVNNVQVGYRVRPHLTDSRPYPLQLNTLSRAQPILMHDGMHWPVVSLLL